MRYHMISSLNAAEDLPPVAIRFDLAQRGFSGDVSQHSDDEPDMRTHIASG